MALFIVSIPFMLLGLAIAIVPLVVTMRRQDTLEDGYVWSHENREGNVTDPYAHFASLDEYLEDDDERQLFKAA
ncbi:MAG: hypothetical protein WCF24_07400 [Acidimicrobiales bacterium]